MAAKTHLKTSLAIVLLFLLLATPAAVHAEIIYVDDDAPGNNDGSSWTNAYNYLQDALAGAASGDEIRVAEGIYKPDLGTGITPGDQQATFELINGVILEGGYAGFSAPDPNARDTELYETVLSGDLNGDDGPNFTDNVDNSYCVVTGSGTDQTCVLDGFTITAANAYGGNGGGMYNRGCSSTIMNCVFSGNSAEAGAGGMHNYLSRPSISNCAFIGNRSNGFGGGMHNEGDSPTLTDCTFNGNSALIGGGIHNYLSDITLTNCTFSGNLAQSDGAGIVNEASSPNLINCVFSENTADRYGGGICNYFSFPVLTNCTFSENSAERGGGMCNNNDSNPTLNNCTFSGNSASYGGGLRNMRGDMMVINCSFAANNTSRDGGAVSNSRGKATFLNCIFSGNSGRYGGGLSNLLGDVMVINCSFIANTSSRYGGAVSNEGGGDLHHSMFLNCIFSGNSNDDDDRGGGIQCEEAVQTLINCTFIGNVGAIEVPEESYMKMQNCIIANDRGRLDFGTDNIVEIDYCCIPDWVIQRFGGTGNFDADPCLVDPDGADDIFGTEDDNLRLLPDSPCIDAGDPHYVPGPNETDLDGRPRVVGGRIDMGAYESQYVQLIPAEADIDPDTLNLQSKGRWITCYIRLPEEYSIADIEPNSVFLEGEIQARPLHVDEEQQVAIAKFNREKVQSILDIGQIELTITGQMVEGKCFEATDVITIINKGNRK